MSRNPNLPRRTRKAHEFSTREACFILGRGERWFGLREAEGRFRREDGSELVFKRLPRKDGLPGRRRITLDDIETVLMSGYERQYFNDQEFRETRAIIDALRVRDKRLK